MKCAWHGCAKMVAVSKLGASLQEAEKCVVEWLRRAPNYEGSWGQGSRGSFLKDVSIDGPSATADEETESSEGRSDRSFDCCFLVCFCASPDAGLHGCFLDGFGASPYAGFHGCFLDRPGASSDAGLLHGVVTARA